MPSRFFPPIDHTSPDDLILVGGRLTVERLLDAYRHGIFPWPHRPEDPMLWFSPDPRAILPLDGMHVSRRLDRRLRSGKFQFTCDQAFAQVLAGCGSSRKGRTGTWLTPEMVDAYVEFHRHGHAHSVETWLDGQLVGGVYGVAIGGLFSAESMFYRERDASKAALAVLVAHLNARGYRLLDIQQWTSHSASLGAIEITRRDYLKRLAEVVDLPVTFGTQLEELSSRRDASR